MSVDDPRLREQLDACRPDPQDRSVEDFPELAAELQTNATLRDTLARSRRWDAALQEVMQRVPVPQDLAMRLLSGLPDGPADAGLLNVVADVAVSSPAIPASGEATLSQTRRRTWLMTAGAALAVTAAVVLVLAYVLPDNRTAVTQRSLEREVPRWMASVDPQRWRLAASPPQAFPVSPVLPLAAHRWQALPQTITQDPVVCYDLTPRGQRPVLLFVMRTPRRVDLPTRPARPTLDTQMLSVGVWRDQNRKDLVYTLAVEGNAQRFEHLIRPQIASVSVPRPSVRTQSFGKT